MAVTKSYTNHYYILLTNIRAMIQQNWITLQQRNKNCPSPWMTSIHSSLENQTWSQNLDSTRWHFVALSGKKRINTAATNNATPPLPSILSTSSSTLMANSPYLYPSWQQQLKSFHFERTLPTQNCKLSEYPSWLNNKWILQKMQIHYQTHRKTSFKSKKINPGSASTCHSFGLGIIRISYQKFLPESKQELGLPRNRRNIMKLKIFFKENLMFYSHQLIYLKVTVFYAHSIHSILDFPIKKSNLTGAHEEP